MADRAPQDGIRHQLISFGLVGAAGFAVDSLALIVFFHYLSWPLAGARITAFALAVTVTWLLNRNLTFRLRRSTRPLPEWGRYVATSIVGAAVNLVIFFALMAQLPDTAPYPFMALAIASLCAMSINFLGAKHLAFVTKTN